MRSAKADVPVKESTNKRTVQEAVQALNIFFMAIFKLSSMG